MNEWLGKCKKNEAMKEWNAITYERMNEWMNQGFQQIIRSKGMTEWLNLWPYECMSGGMEMECNDCMNVTKVWMQRMHEWNEWMNEWMNEMNAWMNEWMNEWLHACMHASMHEWMDVCMHACMHASMNEWMNAWMNEWMNARTN